MDLSSAASTQAAMESALSLAGKFDSLVLNAGITADSPLFFMEEKQWNDVLSVSLNGFFYLCKAVLPGMIQSRNGRIVTLASVSGETGQRGQCNYAAAKGALIAASKSLAKEVGRKGVLVNVVSPGFIETDMTADMDFSSFQSLVPLARPGKPSEVASVVYFLCSDAAAYITGTVIQVNGGLYC
jgi:3-oxoacyl-[acyl-carrier protein] reductase